MQVAKYEMGPGAEAAPPPEGCSTAVDSSGGIEEFCRLHDLRDLLSAAKAIATECFRPKELSCELVQDHESDEQWIVVRVKVSGSPDSVRAAKKQYTSRWIAAAPWPERHLIRLSYDIS